MYVSWSKKWKTTVFESESYSVLAIIPEKTIRYNYYKTTVNNAVIVIIIFQETLLIISDGWRRDHVVLI